MFSLALKPSILRHGPQIGSEQSFSERAMNPSFSEAPQCYPISPRRVSHRLKQHVGERLGLLDPLILFTRGPSIPLQGEIFSLPRTPLFFRITDVRVPFSPMKTKGNPPPPQRNASPAPTPHSLVPIFFFFDAYSPTAHLCELPL